MRTFLALAALAGAAAAGNVTQPLDVKVSLSGGNVTSGKPYGLLLEDLNHAVDGGIYAELIRNRAFQGNDAFPKTLVGWSGLGGAQLSLQNLSQPLSQALPTSMRVTPSTKNGIIGFANEGWWGIAVKVQPYKGSFWVKGTYNGWFTVALKSITSGKILGSVKVKGASSNRSWTEYKYTLVPAHAAENVNNTLEIMFDVSLAKDGYLDFNLISLFPPTYNNRPNGLRKDLVDVMADTQPRLLRFPGGSNLEGLTIESRWDWKATIGPLKDRPGRAGVWTYYETGGMGLVEYMELVEDMQFEPLLGVWSGLAYGSDTSPEVIACNSTDLDYYVQDALNELEFLVGSETSEWGAVRASLGHPDPWNLTYVEIGNEDNLVGGLPSYPCRFQKFSDAIKSKYPWMIPVASTVEIELPPGAAGDYHQYVRPDDLVSQFDYFDHFNQSHKYFNAEYAAVEPNNNGLPVDWGSPFPSYQNWIQAVSEAVYCIGSERNADRVISRGYAPWFKNLNYFTWSPDLITFTADPAETVLSTSYHVVKLFSSYVITKTLPAPSSAGFGPAYWVAGEGERSGSYVFKAAIYNSTMDVPVSLSFDGLKGGTKASLTVLTQKEDAGAPNGLAQNVFGGPDVVQTTVKAVEVNSDGIFAFSLPNLSVAVLATE